jgi:hypothetical protein
LARNCHCLPHGLGVCAPCPPRAITIIHVMDIPWFDNDFVPRASCRSCSFSGVVDVRRRAALHSNSMPSYEPSLHSLYFCNILRKGTSSLRPSSAPSNLQFYNHNVADFRTFSLRFHFASASLGTLGSSSPKTPRSGFPTSCCRPRLIPCRCCKSARTATSQQRRRGGLQGWRERKLARTHAAPPLLRLTVVRARHQATVLPPALQPEVRWRETFRDKTLRVNETKSPFETRI